jgi:FkbM family methyltransferase
MVKFLLRILNKISLLDKVNLNATIRLNGRKFSIPVIGKIGFSNVFMTEPWMVKVLQIIIPITNGTFVDIGANIGQTLLKLKSVSDKVEYVGFEPNPNCIFYLNKLIENNKFRDTHLIPVGISTDTYIGQLFFYYDDTVDASASILEDFRTENKIERREYISIFSFSKLKQSLGLTKISILKIDVEGAELEVLKSFEEDIVDSQPVIMMEILPVYGNENRTRLQRQTEIQNLFRKWGYYLHRVIKQHDVLIEIPQIDEIGIHSDLNSCDYIAIPGSRLSQFRASYLQNVQVSR